MTHTSTDHDLTQQQLRAAADAERDQDIEANREQLLAKLGATQTALAQTRWHLAQLRGNELYDTDFAEGPTVKTSTSSSTTPADSSRAPPESP